MERFDHLAASITGLSPFPPSTIRRAVAELGDDWQASRHVHSRPFVGSGPDMRVMAMATDSAPQDPFARAVWLASQGMTGMEFIDFIELMLDDGAPEQRRAA
jgi:hypothetical protein